ncbi:ferric-chelate reductase fre2 [Trichoderma arundinaceum]|uniref:Ferric-chelate reductase fre2 n=1 Tax=Trichoderma arundinaceum TaxID=490622 RepID=A0A395NKE1_TRIAR|nr:ferric-chelate reductase fre2 [Trichoderma arundinaceum]
MKIFSVELLLFVSSAAATGPVPVTRSGLAGINGFTFYDPFCAHGCFRSFAGFTLPCSAIVSPGGHTTADTTAHNLAECRATNIPYLSSIAWCIHLYCPEDVRASTIERFWETEITGDINIIPVWSYGETIANITQPPTKVAKGKDTVLNMTMITTYDDWEAAQVTLRYFFRETILESYYGMLRRIKPWLSRSIAGSYHDQPLPLLLGNVPTVGQSLYIAVVIILNIVFLAIGYKTSWPNQPNQWYVNRYQELMAYFMWRTGVLAFCNMPVLFLFSTLVLYNNTGSYSTSLTTQWWIWGCVATVAAVIIVLTSVLILRQRAYELFLVTHIVMAVICVVGCWYHVYIGYENTFGYETWLYATIAVWFFDRTARVLRILKTGFRRSKVTDIGSNIVRVDIPSVRWTVPSRCAFVYFPTLSPLRPWENHPFSLVPTTMLTRNKYNDQSDLQTSDETKGHPVTASSKAAVNSKTYTNSGVTLFIRKSAGITRFLATQEDLITMLEGPYPTNPTRSILQSDRLLLIGGGIGITGLLPFLWCHRNVKLFHSVKTADQCLVDSLRPCLDELNEKEIFIGCRLDINSLLRDEANVGWSKIAVVVCGPAGMCDDVRAAVSRIGIEKAGVCSFELEVDAFAW